VCAGAGAPDTTPAIGHYPVDAYDWGFCWRSFDALRACGLYGTDCRFALGDTAQNRDIGTWSDGLPLTALTIMAHAPIGPQPRILLHGTATGANGVAFVEVAIIRRARGRCSEATAAGTFIALRACDRPDSFRFAGGARRWSLRLPAPLRPGSYRVLARAIDGLGQTQVGYPSSARREFTVG